MKIYDVNIVTSDDEMKFKRELKRKIERALTDRFEVEIQYSTAIKPNFKTEYSALVLYKCK